MKPLREQFIDALGYKGKSPDRYRDFTLIVLVGFAVLYGEARWDRTETDLLPT